LRITPGSIIYAEKIEPEAGDIVICDTGTAGRCYTGRFVRGDGFRVLIEIAGHEWIITPKVVLVVVQISDPEPKKQPRQGAVRKADIDRALSEIEWLSGGGS
jgi:hypothetical protein